MYRDVTNLTRRHLPQLRLIPLSSKLLHPLLMYRDVPQLLSSHQQNNKEQVNNLLHLLKLELLQDRSKRRLLQRL